MKKYKVGDVIRLGNIAGKIHCVNDGVGYFVRDENGYDAFFPANTEDKIVLVKAKEEPSDEPVKVVKPVTVKEELNHPDRYGGDGVYECQKVIREWTKDLKGVEAVNVGHILRYVCRYRKKQPIASLRKLIWYAEDIIDELERQGVKE